MINNTIYTLHLIRSFIHLQPRALEICIKKAEPLLYFSMFVLAHVNKFSVAFARTMYLQYLICIIQVSLEN